MRFNYDEKNVERLALATEIASVALEIPSHVMTLNERLWGFHEHRQQTLMAILATRNGILNAVSAAYAAEDDELFTSLAAFLVSKGQDLVDLVQRPCIPGIELSLAILIQDHSAAREIAAALLEVEWEQPFHPEDAKSLIVAMLTLGRAEEIHKLAASPPRFERLVKEDLRGWGLWKDLIADFPDAQPERLRAIRAHENRLVRLELSKMARGRESCFSAVDLVCFYQEGLLTILQSADPPLTR